MLDDVKGVRKFIFVLATVGLATLALLLGKIDAGVFTDLIKWVGGMFILGNAVEHVTDAVSPPGI